MSVAVVDRKSFHNAAYTQAENMAKSIHKSTGKHVHIYVDAPKIQYYITTEKVTPCALQYVGFYPYN